ncbi:hypothetical protein LI90_1416 [Carbonactinospora thermoautotrophica]|uniref:Uncharacterized protein n=1 Tax=Carbonactinospora thermoautotrophica TaxID=1469144 RepID=A0A132MPJ1_9ACTN|nr:hypothetical protein [Carbonactinospora thermoautotrophica]KWW99777.1 hypothetical protein LI90_1416 [Carbonactinospora thermoautotrophica]
MDVSLLEAQGLAALPSLLTPVAVAAPPIAVRGGGAWAATVLSAVSLLAVSLAVYAVLAAAAVLPSFLPSAACLGVAALRGVRA